MNSDIIAKDSSIKTIGINNPHIIELLGIAEEIIERKTKLDIKIFTKTAKNRLKIPKKTLLNLIQYLLSKNILIDGSKFTKDSVLNNINRKKIFDIIYENQAVHFSLIKTKIFEHDSSKSASTGQLVWHLDMLLKFNLIKRIKVRNFTLFLPFDRNEEDAILLFFMKDSINRRIMKILLDKLTLKKGDVYKILNEPRNKVNYRLNYLLEYLILIQNENDEISLNSNYIDKINDIHKEISLNN